MRKLKNVSKKCMIAILTAAMIMSTVTTAIAVPVTVYAETTFTTPNGTIGEGESFDTNNARNVTNNGTVGENISNASISDNNGRVEYNNGTIETNDGTVDNNMAGTINTNNGTVTENFSTITDNNYRISRNHARGRIVRNNENATISNNLGSATVETNGGTIRNNDGTVGANNGTNNGIVENNNGVVINGQTGVVTTNKSGGTVSGNGNVGTNMAGGTVSGTGTITDNYGNVTGAATIENYYSGTLAEDVTITITNNYSENSAITATNQYYSVTITEFENSEAAYTSGFTVKNSVNYLEDSNNGVITITPAEGYEIRGNMGTNQVGTNFTYSLQRNENNVTVTLSSPTGAVTISPDALNLIIALIQQGGGDPAGGGTSVVVRTDNSVKVSDGDNSNASGSTQTYSTGSTSSVTAANILAQIANALTINPGATSVSLDLGNDPSLGVDAIRALCEGNSVVKECHFTHDGRKFVLIIPVVDKESPIYKLCLELLAQEPGGTAGPIKLSQIFAPVGFDLKEE